MKHQFKLQTNDHPLWHLFVCSTCGKDMRISKWEVRRLLKGEWIYVRDFLPPCSSMMPEIKAMASKVTVDKEVTQQRDYMMEWLTDWFARGPAFATEEEARLAVAQQDEAFRAARELRMKGYVIGD